MTSVTSRQWPLTNKPENMKNTHLGNTLQPTAVRSFSSHAPILNKQKRNATNANSWPVHNRQKPRMKQSYTVVWTHDAEFIHSAWSESSAACPRRRGGRREGEKLVPGAFATLERRGPQGRVHIWGVISCKGAERGEWRGPKGRADALAIVVL